MSWTGQLTQAGINLLQEWASGSKTLYVPQVIGLLNNTQKVTLTAANRTFISTSADKGVKIQLIFPLQQAAYSVNKIRIMANLDNTSNIILAEYENSSPQEIPSISDNPESIFELWCYLALDKVDDIEIDYDENGKATHQEVNEAVSASQSETKEYTDNAINALNVSDTADNTKYVSAVSENKGKISVSRVAFNPTVSISAGNNTSAPGIAVNVSGASSSVQYLTKAAVGVYGVTKLSSTVSNSEETLAATPKGVSAAVNGILDSPTFTGVPKAPTASVGTNNTQIATTAFVNQAVKNVSITLDNAVTNTSNNAVTSSAIYSYVDNVVSNISVNINNANLVNVTVNGGTLTNVSASLNASSTAVTATSGDNSNKIATTAFVSSAINAININTYLNYNSSDLQNSTFDLEITI